MELSYIASTDEKYPFFTLIEPLADPAQFIGEWGFYLISAFVAIAWLKFFRHRLFQITHTLIPYLYLLLIGHMLIFFNSNLWLTPIGIILAIITPLAAFASLLTIAGFNGKKNLVHTTLKAITPIESGIEITLQTQEDLHAFQAGQFAFVSFDKKERAHPFSLSSIAKENGLIGFLIKRNGDYTNSLEEKLILNQTVELEGPYGNFNFNDQAEQQIWIAGGIGIAPFLAAIHSPKQSKRITLFYSYPAADIYLLNQLKKKAACANIELHLINTGHSSRLTTDALLTCVNDIKKCSVWYCGPRLFGDMCERAFSQAQLPKHAFHRELFDFR